MTNLQKGLGPRGPGFEPQGQQGEENDVHHHGRGVPEGTSDSIL